MCLMSLAPQSWFADTRRWRAGTVGAGGDVLAGFPDVQVAAGGTQRLALAPVGAVPLVLAVAGDPQQVPLHDGCTILLRLRLHPLPSPHTQPWRGSLRPAMLMR